MTPLESLQKNVEEQIWLAPPQIYEMSRLCGVKNIHSLRQHSKLQDSAGCTRLFPVRVTLSDGIITTLPGIHNWNENAVAFTYLPRAPRGQSFCPKVPLYDVPKAWITICLLILPPVLLGAHDGSHTEPDVSPLCFICKEWNFTWRPWPLT